MQLGKLTPGDVIIIIFPHFAIHLRLGYAIKKCDIEVNLDISFVELTGKTNMTGARG